MYERQYTSVCFLSSPAMNKGASHYERTTYSTMDYGSVVLEVEAYAAPSSLNNLQEDVGWRKGTAWLPAWRWMPASQHRKAAWIRWLPDPSCSVGIPLLTTLPAQTHWMPVVDPLCWWVRSGLGSFVVVPQRYLRLPSYCRLLTPVAYHLDRGCATTARTHPHTAG